MRGRSQKKSLGLKKSWSVLSYREKETEKENVKCEKKRKSAREIDKNNTEAVYLI